MLTFLLQMLECLNISALNSKFMIIRKACFQLQMCLFVSIVLENILKLWLNTPLGKTAKNKYKVP